MIYTVTLNPAVDCEMTVADFCSGKVNRAKSEKLSPGGKGINVSIILNRLGIATKALGICGGETGALLCKLLERSGFPYEMSTFGADKLTRINVKLHAKGVETEINGKGPDITSSELGNFLVSLKYLVADGDTLLLAGSVPDSAPSDAYAQTAERFKGRNVRIAADTSGQALIDLLPMHPFIVKPNNFELGEVLDRSINTHAEALEGAARLQEMGARNVLVSLGGSGAVFLSENGEKLAIEAPQGKVRNTVGAGDSLLAGFLAGLERYGDYKSALALGTAAGSATAFSDTLAERRSITRLYNKIKDSVAVM